MINTEIIDFYDKSNKYITNNCEFSITVFYNCTQVLLLYLTTSGIVADYLLENNNIIVIEFNSKFLSKMEFYSCLLENIQEPINSYSYEYTDFLHSTEIYHIIHNRILVQLHIYYTEDITSYLTINGIHTPIAFWQDLNNLDITSFIVYTIIINYLNDNFLENAFSSFSIM